MRRMTLLEPWLGTELDTAPYEPSFDGPARTRHAECSDLVDLARRMNIPADYAIQQFMDVSFSPPER
jgi:hypothetical protein